MSQAESSLLAHLLHTAGYDMNGRFGGFHDKHGANIRLFDNRMVAHRVDSYNKGVVFTEQPIALGAMFQIKLLDKGGGWAGSIVRH